MTLDEMRRLPDGTMVRVVFLRNAVSSEERGLTSTSKYGVLVGPPAARRRVVYEDGMLGDVFAEWQTVLFQIVPHWSTCS